MSIVALQCHVISTLQQSESVVGIHIYPLFLDFLSIRYIVCSH